MDLGVANQLAEYGKAAKEVHKRLQSSEASADLTVTIGGKSFRCHKTVLSAWSGFFRSMLSKEWLETEKDTVELSETDVLSVECFTVIHAWIYSGKIDLTVDNIQFLLPCAHYLQMQSVIDLCLNELEKYFETKNICGDRIVEHVSFGERFGLPRLTSMALMGMAQQFDSFVQSDGFLDLSVKHLISLLQHPKLTTSVEDTVLKAALLWLRHQDGRLEHLYDVIKEVRLGLVDIPTLCETVNFRIMSHSHDSYDILLNAIARQSNPPSGDFLKAKYPSMFEQRTRCDTSTPSAQPCEDSEESACGSYGKSIQLAYQSMQHVEEDDAMDVRVTVGDRVFPCHRLVLLGWSNYFKRLFHPESDEEATSGEVTLSGDGMTSEAFSVVLDWIYRGALSVTANNLCDVITCARCLQIDSLVVLLEKFMSDKLTKTVEKLTCGELVTLLSQASKLGIKGAHQIAFDEILKKFDAVCVTSEFLEQITVGDLMSILEHKKLKASGEAVVLKAALAWLRHDGDGSRLDHLSDVIKCVRMGLVDIPTLCESLDFQLMSHDEESFGILLKSVARESDPTSDTFLRKKYPTMFEMRIRDPPKDLEDSLNNKVCTFTVTQRKYTNQRWYHCHTCKMVSGLGVCLVCANMCHKDHDLSNARHGPFYCDCGAKTDGSCVAMVCV